ncbi:TIGR03915 family putative DNA repair protein [Christensenellaceae bacterium OttesenSCG-928-L17]|nr:TIGR03915 family putative DNA repair protein [Christensenellaceae bacterium OttesenSCG-928-L17]
MHAGRPLAEPVEVTYLYDGSLAGFYCCVHASVYSREVPMAIYPHEKAQPTLFREVSIATDYEKAARVRNSVTEKISLRARDLIETVFLSCLTHKELHMLRFLLFAYRAGEKAPLMLGHPLVDVLIKAEKHLGGEVHLLLGFVRFSDYDGTLLATITPKNFVLPFMRRHFELRFPNENFMIYDKTHQAALMHENRRSRIVPLLEAEFALPGAEEEAYRALWKRFYDTIAIEARYNPKCRMTHMPKRYWENMIEMQGEA